MILNRIVITEGDPLRFHVNHTENGEIYEKGTGETYFATIAMEDNPDILVASLNPTTADFDFPLNLSEGSYVFEVGIKSADGDKRILLPALDERHNALNQILVLRRLCND